jgi:HPt (histidine-containing phosphotransfer) domain-containing protein
MARFRLDPADIPLINELLARSAGDLAAMRAAAAAGELAPVVSLAHRIAGAAGAFGLERLASAARDAERAARNDRLADARAALEALAAALGEPSAGSGDPR